MSRTIPPESELPGDVRALLPMTPAVFYTLFALVRGEQHGYAIMQSVHALSEGAMPMGPGTLYSTIQRLANFGLIEETTLQKRPDELERRRRFYRLTQLGRRLFDLEIERMQGVLRQVRLTGLRAAEQGGQ